MENANNKMRYYDALKTTPQEAKKTIKGGRLSGFTDINPMWRISALTQTFGPCGIGWKAEITGKWMEKNGDDVKAFVELNLFIRDGEGWSDAIPGLGGASFVSKEQKGLYVSDECYKMAFTDALGSACKLLGMSADVYWKEGYSKCDMPEVIDNVPPMPAPQNTANGVNRSVKKYNCPACGRPLTDKEAEKGFKHFDAPLCEPCADYNWARRVRD